MLVPSSVCIETRQGNTCFANVARNFPRVHVPVALPPLAPPQPSHPPPVAHDVHGSSGHVRPIVQPFGFSPGHRQGSSKYLFCFVYLPSSPKAALLTDVAETAHVVASHLAISSISASSPRRRTARRHETDLCGLMRRAAAIHATFLFPNTHLSNHHGPFPGPCAGCSGSR